MACVGGLESRVFMWQWVTRHTAFNTLNLCISCHNHTV